VFGFGGLLIGTTTGFAIGTALGGTIGTTLGTALGGIGGKLYTEKLINDIKEGNYSVGVLKPGQTVIIKTFWNEYLSFEKSSFDSEPSFSEEPNNIYGVIQVDVNKFYLIDPYDNSCLFGGNPIEVSYSSFDRTYTIKLINGRYLGVEEEGEIVLYKKDDENSGLGTKFFFYEAKFSQDDKEESNYVLMNKYSRKIDQFYVKRKKTLEEFENDFYQKLNKKL
jgi:hypothetical protein